ncbi:aminopeptidase P family protein [Alistipes sp. ZOR0009]|uniref:aminopeptidase P family protein n=1 Tax=Alistipes sp. ZOR0009 TaxID=1339253 RepID=UPI000646DF1A|nr:aminopeptidase P family protein [Alistipes sp. ZOR0009]
MKQIVERLAEVRRRFSDHKIEALIVPSNDPHFSEYVADRWKCREWLSGFTGSAGTLVVTKTSAALWTDSRYFLQGEQQLSGTGIELMRMGLPNVPSIEEYLIEMVAPDGCVGLDGRLFSVTEYHRISQSIKPIGLKIVEDIFDHVWADRPAFPQKKAFILPQSVAGFTISEKIEQVVRTAKLKKEDIFLVTALDEVAWLFNLRGADIEYNPLALAYAAVNKNSTSLFVDKEKLSNEDLQTLEANGVRISAYDNFEKFIDQVEITHNIILNPRKTNILIRKKLQANSINIIDDADVNGVVTSLKGVKNEVEIEGFRKAMVADGVALAKFFSWLDENLDSGKVTECVIAKKLCEFRAQSADFMGESFGSIVGYKEHGAIVHYFPTPETDVEIRREGFLLIDSGGQYRTGTTDITRTIHLSKPTQQEKVDYTLVLKGTIDLSMAVYPAGTRGSQLDILARGPLLQHCINYGHGTGHGVGHFLNVHEGPQSIRMQENPVTLKVGMVTSNEPAMYRTGQYGIRTENLILCVPFHSNEFGTFERFETLTICPIDTTPIEKELLTPSEIEWLNSYHEMVFDALSPHLAGKELAWLEAKTQKI